MANAAVFRTEKTNARTRNATNEPFVLAGRQRVDGVELGASGQVTPSWSILASYAHMRSETVRSANPAEQDRDLAFTPENTFNLWTNYQVNRRLAVGGGAQFMDAVFRNATNTATAAVLLAAAGDRGVRPEPAPHASGRRPQPRPTRATSTASAVDTTSRGRADRGC